MIDKILKFIGDNWETIIAVAGFGISLFNLAYLIRTNWKRIKIKEVFYICHKLDKKYHYEFNMIIANKSRQPISIVEVSFENNGKTYTSKLDREIIRTSKKTGKPEVEFYSCEFPINIGGLEATKEMILFKTDEELEKEDFKVSITTSRGTIKKDLKFKGKKIEVEDYLKKFL